MSPTPSYLEQLNQGRRRRPSTSIDELNRTLEDLETRVGTMSRGAEWYPPRGYHASGFARFGGFNPYQNLAGDMERARRQEEDLAILSELAREMQAMREEMRAAAGTNTARAIEALQSEMERLSALVADMGERGDDRNVNLARLDLDDIRSKLERLSHDSEALAEVTSRLGEAADGMLSLTGPDSAGLDDRLRMLASIVDTVAEQQQSGAPAVLEGIETRLDEIARALAASGQPGRAGADGGSLERIEARIGLLARHMEELASRQADPEIAGQVSALAERVDQLSARADLPEETVIRLADQIALMAERLEELSGAPRIEAALQGVAERFDAVDEQQRDMMASLDARMAELATRLDRFDPSHSVEMSGVMEARLAAMASQIDMAAHSLSRIDPELVFAMQEQVANLAEMAARPVASVPALDDLGPRLEQIERAIETNRERLVEAASRATAEALGAGQPSPAMDHDTLSRLAEELRKLDQLTRRSDERNSRTFEAIHDTLLKVVERLDLLAPSTGAQALPIGILDTPPLVPEIDEPQPESAVPPKRLAKAARGGKSRTPAQAALEAARAAIDEEPTETPKPESRSLFGGLARAFSRRKSEKPATNPAPLAGDPIAALEAQADAPSVEAPSNRPLEPGSGAPDLSAIMRRVRDERGQQGAKDGPADPAKSDFIAAARRAAQAAAAEAEMMKGKPEKGVATGLKRLLPSGRKTVMLGLMAVLLAIGGMQVASNFAADRQASPLADAGEQAASEMAAAIPVIEEARPVDAAPVARAATITGAPMANLEPTPRSATPATKLASLDPTAVGAVPTSLQGAGETTAPLFEVPAEAGPQALREAAEAGDPVALYAIGERYAEGRGVPVDLSEAARWFERAADSGLAPAQYRLGNMYEKGKGVTRDFAEAMRWYAEAAEEGHATAMHNLAVLHATGPDGNVDNEAAATLFRSAAEHGVRDSQFNMGILATRGVGTRQDLEEGYRWFAVVAAAGDKDAAEKRDEVGRAMTGEQLERARAAAEAWKPLELDAFANTVDYPDGWMETEQVMASLDAPNMLAEIQRLLISAGYDAGATDGVMGAKTRDAIIAYQRDSGMDATGQVDEALLSALVSLR